MVCFTLGFSAKRCMRPRAVEAASFLYLYCAVCARRVDRQADSATRTLNGRMSVQLALIHSRQASGFPTARPPAVRHELVVRPDPSRASAGGSAPAAGVPSRVRAANYYRWAASFPDDIEVWLIELPGRGKSLGTRAIDTLSELIDFLRAILRPLLPRDYSVFGLAWGADRVLFRARYGAAGIRPSGSVRPARMRRSTHRHAPLDGAPVHRRNDADIVDYVVSLGGAARSGRRAPGDAAEAGQGGFPRDRGVLPAAVRNGAALPVTVFSGRDDTLRRAA